MLTRIKAKGIHPLNLAPSCIQGGADPLALAVAHAIFLAQAGVTVSEAASYAFIVGGSQDVIDFQFAFVSAVLPSIDLGEKPPPRPTTGRGRTKKTQT